MSDNELGTKSFVPEPPDRRGLQIYPRCRVEDFVVTMDEHTTLQELLDQAIPSARAHDLIAHRDKILHTNTIHQPDWNSLMNSIILWGRRANKELLEVPDLWKQADLPHRFVALVHAMDAAEITDKNTEHPSSELYHLIVNAFGAVQEQHIADSRFARLLEGDD